MDSKDKYISQLELENRYLRRLLDDNGIVYDKSLIWYGSMNLLSNPKEEDSLMRLENKSVAEELLHFSIIKYSTLK